VSIQQIGIIGMSIMGSNLALNIERHGYSVSIFNRSKEKTEKVISKNYGKNLIPYFSIKEFVLSLDRPRCILLMVKAGESTDKTITMIENFLDIGDILIDGGNAFYKDTIRRDYQLSKRGINFIGAGISGGSVGALKGPSIMPGGRKEAYELVASFFKRIAARVEEEVCVTYIGPDGSGHYTKMVHNGIEYGDMQLIAEAYALLKNFLGLSNDQLANIFSEWNCGELNSYLISICKDIFLKKENKNSYLIDHVLDKADSKGTGKWSSQSAMDLEEPLNLITESVFARYISSFKKQRIIASKILFGPIIQTITDKKETILFIEKIRRALYLGKIIAYAQGFSQLKAASNQNNWNLNYGEIAKIFRSGCIIRAKFLQKIVDAFILNKEITNLLLSPYFSNIANNYQKSLRDVVSYAIKQGIPVPALSSAISYYDSYRSAFLPANLIQAQRDCFGDHNYQRLDKKGIFHTKWSSIE